MRGGRVRATGVVFSAEVVFHEVMGCKMDVGRGRRRGRRERRRRKDDSRSSGGAGRWFEEWNSVIHSLAQWSRL